MGKVQIPPQSGAGCGLGDKKRAPQALLWVPVSGIPRINYRFVLENGFILVYLRFIPETLSIRARVKLFSALSVGQGRFPGDLEASPTQHRVLLELPVEHAAEFGADAKSRVFKLGMLHPFRKLLPQTLILSCPGCCQSWTWSHGKKIKSNSLCWQRPGNSHRNPTLPQLPRAKPREDFGSASEYFKLRTDFVLMHFHDNLKGKTRWAVGVKGAGLNHFTGCHLPLSPIQNFHVWVYSQKIPVSKTLMRIHQLSFTAALLPPKIDCF